MLLVLRFWNIGAASNRILGGRAKEGAGVGGDV